jgi:hypothetical protein
MSGNDRWSRPNILSDYSNSLSRHLYIKVSVMPVMMLNMDLDGNESRCMCNSNIEFAITREAVHSQIITVFDVFLCAFLNPLMGLIL